MARGRPRKPVPDLILEGRYRHDRHGDANEVWIPDGAPECPAYLDDEAKTLWNALIPGLASRAVATEVDTASLAALCEWWSRYRKASTALALVEQTLGVGSKEYYRAQQLTGMAWNHFADIASKFGLNPSDRAKLRLDPDALKEDELLQFTKK